MTINLPLVRESSQISQSQQSTIRGGMAFGVLGSGSGLWLHRQVASAEGTAETQGLVRRAKAKLRDSEWKVDMCRSCSKRKPKPTEPANDVGASSLSHFRRNPLIIARDGIGIKLLQALQVRYENSVDQGR